MNRRGFLKSILGIIPAVAIAKELIPKKEELVFDKAGGEIGNITHVIIDPDGGDFTSIASAENFLTMEDIEEAYTLICKQKVNKYVVDGKPFYPQMIHPRIADDLRFKEIPFITHKPTIINNWSV